MCALRKVMSGSSLTGPPTVDIHADNPADLWTVVSHLSFSTFLKYQYPSFSFVRGYHSPGVLRLENFSKAPVAAQV